MGFFQPSTWTTKKKTRALPRCGQCGLAKQCISPRMQPYGEGRRGILIVGEAPGETEDRQGRPFIGNAGRLLRSVAKNAHLNLDRDCWLTNAVICRPPKNTIDDMYIEACRPNLIKTIKRLQPRVVVLLGLSAIKSLIGTEWGRDIGPMSRWAGWSIPSRAANAWVCPSYHPSYLMRSNEDLVLMQKAEGDLANAVSLASGQAPPILKLEELQRSVEVIEDPQRALVRMRNLAKQSGVLAFDYETTGLKPERAEQRIVSVSFCLDGADTFACMLSKRHHSALSRILRNPKLKKVASNLKFEERWTRHVLGHPVANWHWDTMLAAHVLDNRSGITSLKFQVYVEFGVPDYEAHVEKLLKAKKANDINRIAEIHPRDLLIYNGMDSLLEYMLCQRQRLYMGLA